MNLGLSGQGARREHVLLVGSSGGHLAQLMNLKPWWSQCSRTWVTCNTPDAVGQLRGESVVWGHFPTTRSIPNLLRNTVLAWFVLRRERPAIIISTGAGIALPFFAIGRLLGATTIYIEVFDRIDSAALTGRLVQPFTQLMCVQWDEQLQLYPDAKVIGPLL